MKKDTDRIKLLESIYDSFRHDPSAQLDIRKQLITLRRMKS